MTRTRRQLGGSHAAGPLVVGTAAVNGLAYDSHQTWAFWRADASALTETPFRLQNGERATMGIVRSLDPTWYGPRRLSTLTEAALMHLGGVLGRIRVALRVGVWIAAAVELGDARDPYFGPYRRSFERRITSFFETRGVRAPVQLVCRGHAGFAHVVEAAREALTDGSVDLAIVGGADTYYDPLRFDMLEEAERIFDQRRTDAFIPGEGAAFAVLVRPSMARQLGLESLCAIETVATDEEPAPMGSERACTGVGLTRVMRACTERLKADGRRLDWMLGDLTNESYRARELQLALPRAMAPGGLDTAGATYREVAAEGFRGDFLPEAFGDLGAATMPTALTIATEAFLRGDPKAAGCMIVGSSTNTDRGAMLVAATT